MWLGILNLCKMAAAVLRVRTRQRPHYPSYGVWHVQPDASGLPDKGVYGLCCTRGGHVFFLQD